MTITKMNRLIYPKEIMQKYAFIRCFTLKYKHKVVPLQEFIAHHVGDVNATN